MKLLTNTKTVEYTHEGTVDLEFWFTLGTHRTKTKAIEEWRHCKKKGWKDNMHRIVKKTETVREEVIK